MAKITREKREKWHKTVTIALLLVCDALVLTEFINMLVRTPKSQESIFEIVALVLFIVSTVLLVAKILTKHNPASFALMAICYWVCLLTHQELVLITEGPDPANRVPVIQGHSELKYIVLPLIYVQLWNALKMGPSKLGEVTKWIPLVYMAMRRPYCWNTWKNELLFGLVSLFVFVFLSFSINLGQDYGLKTKILKLPANNFEMTELRPSEIPIGNAEIPKQKCLEKKETNLAIIRRENVMKKKIIGDQTLLPSSNLNDQEAKARQALAEIDEENPDPSVVQKEEEEEVRKDESWNETVGVQVPLEEKALPFFHELKETESVRSRENREREKRKFDCKLAIQLGSEPENKISVLSSLLKPKLDKNLLQMYSQIELAIKEQVLFRREEDEIEEEVLGKSDLLDQNQSSKTFNENYLFKGSDMKAGLTTFITKRKSVSQVLVDLRNLSNADMSRIIEFRNTRYIKKRSTRQGMQENHTEGLIQQENHLEKRKKRENSTTGKIGELKNVKDSENKNEQRIEIQCLISPLQSQLLHMDSSSRNIHRIRHILLSIRKGKGGDFEILCKADCVSRDQVNMNRLLSLITHEMRSPLVAISGFIKIFRMNLESCASVSDAISLSNEYLERSNSYIDFQLDACQVILDFTKFGSKSKLRTAEFDLKKIIQDITKMFADMNKSKPNLRITYHYPEDCNQFVKSDPVRIKQILINLISNAVKYTMKGSVSVNVQMISFKEIKVSVEDTGTGIKPMDMKTLFREFGKIRNKEDQILNENGVGLGLNLSNELAYMISPPSNRGGIEVESEYGVGSKFSFRVHNKFSSEAEYGLFVMKRASYSGSNLAGHIQDKIDVYMRRNTPSSIRARELCSNLYEAVKIGEQLNILIVDDSDFNLEVSLTFYNKLGVECTTSTNPPEALEIIQKKLKNICVGCQTFDFIILDYEMPYMNGDQLCTEIQKIPGYANVPILCSTAQDFKNLEHLSQFTQILIKPFSFNDAKLILEKFGKNTKMHSCFNNRLRPVQQPQPMARQTSQSSPFRGVVVSQVNDENLLGDESRKSEIYESNFVVRKNW
jgi:signal transduction histidine kinase/CheY-like chemotaxis protein